MPHVEGEVPAPDTVTRPPTVELSQENIDHLKSFPRPPKDNGIGLHFDLDLRDEGAGVWRVVSADWRPARVDDFLDAL